MKCPRCQEHELEIRKQGEERKDEKGKTYAIIFRCYSFCHKCGVIDRWTENSQGTVI